MTISVFDMKMAQDSPRRPLTALCGIGNGRIHRKPLTGFPEAVTRFWRVSGRG